MFIVISGISLNRKSLNRDSTYAFHGFYSNFLSLSYHNYIFYFYNYAIHGFLFKNFFYCFLIILFTRRRLQFRQSKARSF